MTRDPSQSAAELSPSGVRSDPSDRPRGWVLSLFPGVDLLGRAFALEGWHVACGPDTVTGGDIRSFRGRPGAFDGIIGGPPCQDFSKLRRVAPSGHGVAMLREYLRVVLECQTTWWLLENVPGVPDVACPGYSVQRLDLTDLECGGVQRRLRHFQFGHQLGWILRPDRHVASRSRSHGRPVKAVLARDMAPSRSYAEICRRQGLPAPIALPGWSRTARVQAVGNGVPIAMGRTMARAAATAGPRDEQDCKCGCGRRVTPPAAHATAACRKREERKRKGGRPLVRAQVSPR